MRSDRFLSLLTGVFVACASLPAAAAGDPTPVSAPTPGAAAQTDPTPVLPANVDPDDGGSHEVASYKIETELKFMTDNRTRGMSDTLGLPAFQASFFAAHESGLVGLLQVVNVSDKVFTDAYGVNITTAVGYRTGDPDGLHGGLGVAAETFPGAHFFTPYQIDYSQGFPNPFDIRKSDYNTQYGVLELGYGALEGRVLVVLSRDYRGADTGGVCGQLLFVSQFAGGDPSKALNCYAKGIRDTRGTLLFDLDYTQPFLPDLIPDTTYRLHVGYQKVANFPAANTFDYKAGLTHRHWGFDFTLEYIGTSVKARELYLYASGNKLLPVNGQTVVFSVARKF